MKILQGGMFVIPLYHGTSSIFVDSILEHGLGAKNPVRELGVHSFFKHAYEVYEQLFADDPSKFVYERIMNQSIHFQHGAVFLSPSRDTAARYALSNKYGSELLSEAVILYDRTGKRDPNRLSDPEFRDSPVIQLLDEKPQPVLVEVSDVPVKSVVEEQTGGDAKPIIKIIQSIFDETDDLEFAQTLCQQQNFRLIEPVAASQLKVYEVIRTDDKYPPAYDLREVEW